jgi:hypothetical protein
MTSPWGSRFMGNAEISQSSVATGGTNCEGKCELVPVYPGFGLPGVYLRVYWGSLRQNSVEPRFTA